MLTLNGSGLLQQAVTISATFSGDLPPSNISPPELVGKAEVGATVSARPGVWAGLPAPQVQTTLFVSGVARRSPCLLGSEDDGKEIIITDAASNDAGEAVVSSSRGFVRHSVPHALGTPEDVSIGAYDEAVVVDAGAFFVGTSGGQWSATCAIGADALQLDIDETGRMTLGGGTMTGSSVVSVRYSNSGGSASAKFTVSFGETESVAGPKYDGSLGDLSITSKAPVEIEAGLAFSGDNLAFSATGLPEGISIDPEIGRISGLTSNTGSYSVTVAATNSVGSAEGVFTLDITEKPLPLPDAPTYDGSLQAWTAVLDSAFELSAGDAFAGESLTFAATGLPPDLGIDAKSGGIIGTLSSTGEFAITVTATNPGGKANGTFSLTVAEVPLAAPAYDGSLHATGSTVGVAFALSAGSAFAGDELIFSAQDLAPGLIMDAATGRIAGTLTSEGIFSTKITAKNSAGEASGSFEMAVTKPGKFAPAAPTYDGTAANLDLAPDVAMKPVDLSVHFTGAEISYSATGLPSGLSIDNATGLISGTPNGTAFGPATVMASNPGGTARATFAISVGEQSSGGENPAPTGAAFVASTGMAIDVARATIGIGGEEAGREVYFSVLAGGVEDAGLTVNGGATGLTLVASNSYPNRSAQTYRATGLTGTTADIALTGAANSEYTAAFKAVGYRPASGAPWITGRQVGNDSAVTTLNVTIPKDGAALLHGKKYNGLSASPAGTVIDKTASNAMHGYWKNNTGASAAVTFTFTTAGSKSEKYAAVLILEKTQ